MNVSFLTVGAQKNSFGDIIENGLGWIGNLETLYGVICFVGLLLLFWRTVVLFRKSVNSISLRQVSAFKRNKKYIPELFTELNGNLENLRYFVFSNRWKRRIIREYNRQFSNAQGKEIAHILSNDLLTRKLPYKTNVDDLMGAINQRSKVIEQIKEDKEHNRKKYGEKFFYIREYTYFIPAKLAMLYAVVFLLYKATGQARKENVLSLNDRRYIEFLELVDSGTSDLKIGFDSCQSPAINRFCPNIAKESIEFCDSARFSMYIDCDLKAYPCSFAHDSPAYAVDISTCSIKDAWESNQFAQFREA